MRTDSSRRSIRTAGKSYVLKESSCGALAFDIVSGSYVAKSIRSFVARFVAWHACWLCLVLRCRRWRSSRRRRALLQPRPTRRESLAVRRRGPGKGGDGIPESSRSSTRKTPTCNSRSARCCCTAATWPRLHHIAWLRSIEARHGPAPFLSRADSVGAGRVGASRSATLAKPPSWLRRTRTRIARWPVR